MSAASSARPGAHGLRAAPGITRAVLPALNMDAFYAAFPEVQPGDPEYIAPQDRVVIW